MSAPHSHSTANGFTTDRLRTNCTEDQTADPARHTNLVSLVNFLGLVFATAFDKCLSDPVQDKFNKTTAKVFDGVATQLPVLYRLIGHCSEDFGNNTLLRRLSTFPRPSKEEYEEYKGFYINKKLSDTPLSEVYPSDVVRLIRFALGNLLFAIFHTFDPNEKKEVFVKGKMMNVDKCNPENATYLHNGRPTTSEAYHDFLTDLIALNKFFSKFTLELSELTSPFVDAAKTAKS